MTLQEHFEMEGRLRRAQRLTLLRGLTWAVWMLSALVLIVWLAVTLARYVSRCPPQPRLLPQPAPSNTVANEGCFLAPAGEVHATPGASGAPDVLDASSPESRQTQATNPPGLEANPHAQGVAVKRSQVADPVAEPASRRRP